MRPEDGVFSPWRSCYVSGSGFCPCTVVPWHAISETVPRQVGGPKSESLNQTVPRPLLGHQCLGHVPSPISAPAQPCVQ